jgi:hypothetical protein
MHERELPALCIGFLAFINNIPQGININPTNKVCQNNHRELTSTDCRKKKMAENLLPRLRPERLRHELHETG